MPRFWIRTLIGVLGLATLAVAAPAVQAKGMPDPHALRNVGLKVSWPLAVGPMPSVTPGTPLTVKVKRVGRSRGAAVTLSLARTAPSGRILSRVKTKTLRKGTFTVRAPRTGRYYALTLRAGKVRYAGRFTLASTKPIPGDGGIIDPCRPTSTSAAAAQTPAAVLHLGATTVQAGQAVPYSIENTGTTCLGAGYPYRWQRLVGDTWTDVPQELAFIMPLILIPPGKTWAPGSAATEVTFPAGRYRLLAYVEKATAMAEIDVTQAPCNELTGHPDIKIHVDTTTVPSGGSIPFRYENVGTGCGAVGLSWSWEKLVDGAWVPVPHAPFPPNTFLLSPGQPGESTAQARDEVGGTPLDPGHYRLSFQAVPDTFEIDVTDA